MTNVLELDSIAFGFPDGPALRHVLHGVDLAVSAGEMVAVMAPAAAVSRPWSTSHAGSWHPPTEPFGSTVSSHHRGRRRGGQSGVARRSV